MYFNITCSPPLGQSTQVPRSDSSVRFAVLVETLDPIRVGDDAPQVCLWHNHRDVHEWDELPLSASTELDGITLFNRPTDHKLFRTWFIGDLSGRPGHNYTVKFTVKFKVVPHKDWRWVKDSSGIDDGQLIYLNSGDQIQDSRLLTSFIEGISDDITIKSERPETDDTTLFSLTCPVRKADGKDSAYQLHQLGKPRRLNKWFALVRLWSPWLAPRQGAGNLTLDRDGVLLSFQRMDGLHVVCLGISGTDNTVTTFLNDSQGNMIIKCRSDSLADTSARVLIAIAESFDVANAAVFYHARKVVGTNVTGTADEDISALTSDKVRPEWLEEWYDGLTYCTWNGLGQKLSAEKIYVALDELAKNDITISNLIIDDNWQSLSTGETQFKRGWTDFEANPEGFPDGLKATTSEIRKRHPNINHIAVWHAILGYWGAIDPDGKIAQKYRTQEVEIEPGVAGGKATVVSADDIQAMYNDFYAFLSDSGVDSVKTDAQFFLDMLLHAPDRRALTVEYQDAWTIAHLRHFSSRAISCMSQTPQIMFHSQLATNKPRLLVRNSDDFFPDVAASHPWHVFCNAHNSVFMEHLNVLPDWDMFQTSHEWAGFHAAARCVSGGPIYFTDYPGQHDHQLISQMTAQTTRGKTVILRPHLVGKSINPYNAYDSRTLLKIGTYVGMARTGTGILGVFNVLDHHQSEMINLADFPGTENGEYVVGSFRSGHMSSPSARGRPDGFVGLELEPQGWDILTAYAVHHFEVDSASLKVAFMGLVHKMTGSAAVTGSSVYLEENSRLRIWTSLKALGVLGIWISDLADRVISEDFMILILGKPIPEHCVKKSGACGQVLEIDVAEAWRENKERAGWSNEVSVEVFLRTKRR